MKKINIRKIIYNIRTKYLTLNHVVIAVALLIAVNWMWGALEMMQRNYSLQREVDAKSRQLQLTELQRDSLALQKRYYQTDEFLELAARESMGLVMPGEKTLIIPESGNTSAVDGLDSDPETSTSSLKDSSGSVQPGNMEQWFNFLFGGNSKLMSRDKE